MNIFNKFIHYVAKHFMTDRRDEQCPQDMVGLDTSGNFDPTLTLAQRATALISVYKSVLSL